MNTIEMWGPEYKIEFQFKLNSKVEPNAYHNIINLTQEGGKNSFGYGGRIPTVFIANEQNREWLVLFVAQKSGQNVINQYRPLSMGKMYNVQLLHTVDKKAKAGTFKWIINGEEVWNVTGTDSTPYKNVYWYQSDPWHLPASQVADVRCIRVFNNGTF